MAWTTPKTWASGYVVLAADLNTHLRDNLNVTAPAVLTTAGDILYASGANTPARLAKSTTSTQYLANTGTSNAPAWNEVALATGVSGTLPVGNGGTGATTLTANGALIGNGTSAIASVDMSTKGGLLVGDGSGNPSVLAVGGTADHVLTVDSGEATGIKWSAVATVPDAATQAELEAASSTSTYTSPGRQQYHPTACKMWCSIEITGTLESPSYNVASVGDTGTGNRDINFTTAFSTDTFPSWAAFTVSDQGQNKYIVATMNSTGDMNLIVRTDAGGLDDAATAQGSFGDQT
jgi:hypothetical protein